MKNVIIIGILALIAAGGMWWYANDTNNVLDQEMAKEIMVEVEEKMMDKMDDVTQEETATSSVSAAGTQLAGTQTPTVDADGNELIGGDAVAPEETPGEVSFTVLGGKFYYDLEEIRVKKGDTVTINFRSVDGFHDWVLDEFDARTQAVDTDGESSVTFVADEVGEFEYYCSVGNHRAQGQVGKFIVEE